MTRRRSLLQRAFLPLMILGGAALLTGVAYVGWIATESENVAVFRNVSPAMEPTLLPGDRFTVSVFGDARVAARMAVHDALVAHSWPVEPGARFVKRIAGIPGDTLAMRRGTLLRNGRTVNESGRAWHSKPGALDSAQYNNWGPLVVPTDSVFVLGDNRDGSLDSRYHGFVPVEHLYGQALRVYFSRDPETGRIRWSRFGRRLR